MEAALQEAVEGALAEGTSPPSRVVGARAIGGGSIHRTALLELADGRTLFLKHHPQPPARIFECEAEGLRALAAVGAIRVPGEATAGAAADGTGFLVMEAIPTGPPPPGLQARFGRQLAELHLATRGRRCGFEQDNYIGSTPQPNGWMDDWVGFWRERRLGHQLDLAHERGLADRQLLRLGDRLLGRLDELLGEPAEPPCLLHGDLWGGNYLVADSGEPVLIDPAVYNGRREADLAMTLLFGGFEADFYAAYEEAWALAPGSEDRLEVYKLYHLLNHLNLFGGGYRSGCLAILRRFA